MQLKKNQVVVNSFHYDLVKPESQVKNDLNVTMNRMNITHSNGELDKGEEGHYFEMKVPFEIVPQDSGIKVTGQVSQLIQTIDYYGEANELDGGSLEEMTRPLIEKIEELVYAITEVTLDEPVRLTFRPNR
ncbi:DUF1149 family protein [Holzapfeliella sp. He02]|uniref:DUF1149 family protein n=1 Tax=Holzapfeliella saturejae TaxID=3082953 RepID=A0ABU8SFN1_9LACO